MQIAVPLLVGVMLGAPRPAVWLLVASALCGFFSHEALLVWIGRRGTRAQRLDGGRARARFALLGLLGAAALAGALVLAPSALVYLALPGGLALCVGIAIAQGRERTLAGEVFAAMALAATAVPVAIAAGVSSERALLHWLVWCDGFAAVTVAVRALRPQRDGGRLAPWLVLIGSVGIVLGLWWLRAPAAIACVPLLVAALGVLAWSPSPRYLRRVGIVVTVVALLTGALLVRIV